MEERRCSVLGRSALVLQDQDVGDKNPAITEELPVPCQLKCDYYP